MSLSLLIPVALPAALPPGLVEQYTRNRAGRSRGNVAADALRAAETRP